MPPASRVTRGSVASAEDFTSLSTRERLIFAQAVYEYGAKQSTWAEISKLLSKHPLVSRPKGFFTAQTCSAIYNYLMNEANLTPSELASGKKAREHLQLAQRHYRERITNLKDEIVGTEQRFKTLVQEIEDIKAGQWDDKILAKLNGADMPMAVDLPEEPRAPLDKKEELVEMSQTEGEPVASQDEEQMEQEVSMDVSSSPRLSSPPREKEAIASIEVEESTEKESAHSLVAQPRKEEPLLGAATNEQTSASPRTGESGALEGSPNPIVQAQDEDEIEEQDEDYEATVESPQVDKAEIEDTEIAAQQSESEERQPFSREEETTDAASHESTPAPPIREFKRRASELDGNASDILRDRKRLREESEPVDLDDADSPATPSAAPSGARSTKERSRFQRVIYMLHSQISAHRNGTIFHHPIKPSEAPDYRDIVKRPMDLKTIKKRVRNGKISTSREYQRDIYLMFANSLMYNRPNSDIYVMAEEMMLDSEAHINNFQQTEVFNEARTRT